LPPPRQPYLLTELEAKPCKITDSNKDQQRQTGFEPTRATCGI